MPPFRSQLVTSRAYPLLRLDGLIGHRERHWLLHTLAWLAFLLALILIIASLSSVIPNLVVYLALFQSVVPKLVGGLFIIFSIWFSIYLLEAYFRDHYFSLLLPESGDLFTFEIGRLLYRAEEPDPLIACLVSKSGGLARLRLGIPEASLLGFLETHRGAVSPTAAIPALPIEPGQVLTFEHLLGWLFDHYPDFSKWLLEFEIRRDDLTGAASWLARQTVGEQMAEQWWSRERLARLPGLAKDWSYGETARLDQYASDLRASPDTALHPDDPLTPSPTALQVETILARDREANAVLIGPAGGQGPHSIVLELVKLIKRGRVAPVLEHRRPVFLETARLLASFREAEALEKEILAIVHEVIAAGNILLIIDDLPNLIVGARTLGAPIEKLLDPFLASAAVPLLALADVEAHHRVLEPLPELMNRFEVVTVAETDPNFFLTALE